jgi:diguanylate cyclase (GGDEF)-like protein/PAS domain S-box-containing protein
VTVRDVSARRRDEERLRDLEARWRLLLQGSPDAILVCDRDGRILSVNEQAERLFGYARQELLGREVEALVPEALRAAHAERRLAYAQAPTSRAMGGTAVLSGRHRDGHAIPLEIGLNAIETAEGTWVMAIAHDLTSRQQHLERIRLLSTALEAAASAVAISDPKGNCLWVNRAFTEVTGYEPDEIVGRPLSLLKSGVHDEGFYRGLWSTILAGRPWHGQIVNRHRLGHNYTEEQTIAPVRDEQGAITHFVAIKQDVTERLRVEADLLAANQQLHQQVDQIEALRERLYEQAIRDPLTGLFNRRFLTETLERELARARRAKLPLAVVLLDVDHFKQVNDTSGHRAGDQLLRALAGLLTEQTRREDLVCRYGGEEFVVLMPGASLEAALARAEAWRAAVEQLRLSYEGQAVQVTISAGVAAFPHDGADESALLRAADEALYRSKSSGRNRVTAHACA